ncbi:glycosyltransferase family 2 protein [Mycoplana rhizolycopersici]|uniref:Glycosyltransferase family 2 protein n=1 Tax=Mycoplana rhizolycopersici TaxID=2746702 RepID=A0ABX2QAU8_9HYPH|nr:glycosyltransferase family A protein [Rhizobium rhizolycopersici]NVP54862.1 glycosyltransferase family 2 protein [Rhizobium rhizolycopersici]
MIAFAERTALREDVFGADRIISQVDARKRTGSRIRFLLTQFWRGKWAYQPNSDLEPDGARYVQFGWKSTAKLTSGAGSSPDFNAVDLATELVSECLALRMLLNDKRHVAKSPKDLWTIVKKKREEICQRVRGARDGEARVAALSEFAAAGSDAMLYSGALEEAAGLPVSDNRQSLLAAFFSEIEAGTVGREDVRRSPEGELERADLLVRAGRVLGAISLLARRNDKEGLARRLILDHALRTDWDGYAATIHSVTDPDLSILIDELAKSGENAGLDGSDALGKLTTILPVVGLPNAYETALVTGRRNIHRAPHSALANWRAAKYIQNSTIDLTSAPDVSGTGALFALSRRDRITPAWRTHLNELSEAGISLGFVLPPNEHPDEKIALELGETLFDTQAVDAFRTKNTALLIAEGRHFIAAELAQAWRRTLGNDSAMRLPAEYLCEMAGNPLALQYAYSDGIPGAVLLAPSAKWSSADFLTKPGKVIADLAGTAKICPFGTVSIASTGANEEAPLVIVFDGPTPPKITYDGPVHAISIDATAEDGAGGLASRLSTLPSTLSADTPVLFLSRDMKYPPYYVRNALAAFRDHGHRFELTFLALRRSTRDNACLPLERNVASLTSMCCLAASCMSLARAKALGEAPIRLSSIIEANVQTFLMLPLFDVLHLKEHDGQIARYLSVESDETIISLSDRQPLTLPALDTLGEASKRLLSPIVRRREYLRQLAEGLDSGDFDALQNRQLSSVIALCRENLQTGYLGAARRMLERIICNTGPEIAAVPEFRSLMMLVSDVGCHEVFAIRYRHLLAHIVRHQPRLTNQFVDLLAVHLAPREMEMVLMAGVSAVRSDKPGVALLRVLETLKRYGSPAVISWALVNILGRVNRDAIASDTMANAFHGLLRRSDLDDQDIADLDLGGRLSKVLAAETIEEIIRSALAAGDVDTLVKAINDWIRDDRPLLRLAQELRSYTHLLSQAQLADRVSAYRRYDTFDARMVFATIIGDREYLSQHLPETGRTDAEIIARGQLDKMDWLETHLETLGAPLGIRTAKFETGSLERFFNSILAARHETSELESPLPRVSVVMTVLDPDLRLLKLAVESILRQEGVEVELILIDDGSSVEVGAEIAQLASGYPEIILERFEQNQGPYVGRNRALEIASAPYLAILDGDDVAHPARLRTQIDALERAGAQAMLATSWHMRIDGAGRPQFEQDFSLLGDGTMTSVFRTEVFSRIGPFANVRSRGDVEMRERIRSAIGAKAIVHVDYPLVYCYAAPTTLSNRTARLTPQYLQLFRANFARHHRHLRQAVAVGEVIAPPNSIVPMALRP